MTLRLPKLLDRFQGLTVSIPNSSRDEPVLQVRERGYDVREDYHGIGNTIRPLKRDRLGSGYFGVCDLVGCCFLG